MNKNIPNILTISRIICTPLIILMFLLPIKNGIGVFIALGIYIVGCLTDLFDGKIARKYNLVSDFGKFMDQIADKFITTTAMILVLFSGVTYSWLAVLMLLVVVLRDILISGIRMVAANKNIVISADIFGKVKSFFLDISNMVLMLFIGLRAISSENFVDIIGNLGIAIMVVGVVLSIVSCVNYSVKALEGLGIIKKAIENEDGESDGESDGDDFNADEIDAEKTEADDSQEEKVKANKTDKAEVSEKVSEKASSFSGAKAVKSKTSAGLTDEKTSKSKSKVKTKKEKTKAKK